MVRIKLQARSFVFWPNINEEIENKIRKCSTCQMYQNVPSSEGLLSWSFTNRVWERVHIDFLDFESHKIFIIIDTHSKWMDA